MVVLGSFSDVRLSHDKAAAAGVGLSSIAGNNTQSKRLILLTHKNPATFV